MDNWEHRSEGMKCKYCMWFAPKAEPGVVADLGRCRRHAPTADLGYPAVFVNDWCGDHKINEKHFYEPNNSPIGPTEPPFMGGIRHGNSTH